MPDGAGLPREVKDGQGGATPDTPSHKGNYLCEQQAAASLSGEVLARTGQTLRLQVKRYFPKVTSRDSD